MSYAEVRVLTKEESVEAICNILHETGANGVVIEDPEVLNRTWESTYGEIYDLSPADYPVEGVLVKGYFDVQPELEEMVKGIRQDILQLSEYGLDIGSGEVSWAILQDEDWTAGWKQHYQPVHVTSYLTISPSWIDYEQAEGEQVISLDPGMAFGTGTHPTTTLTIQALASYMKPGVKIYDVGCGTGILSIAAVKLGAQHVDALDLDDIAVQSTIANCELNHVSHAVHVNQNNLLDGYSEPVDLIMANLLADIILRLTPQAVSLLKDEGIYIVSGILAGKEEPVLQQLAEYGMRVLETKEEENWVVIVAQKK
ncbi:50S ribosomal protein L11 methyltransferase [Rubeoparvulum massiliense]|uniref:50S ribosomal protein L11 methyltransferase n=1 Tax=Rubeoparvulum massiliense TaxID=1631346 RepID=UPI00065E0AB3|nr:50S ribosomal protein L11 methyltransferase [Rubeoparvulum massiliense]